MRDDPILISRAKASQNVSKDARTMLMLPNTVKVYDNSIKMNEDTKNTLNCVAVKLHKQMLNGLNLQLHEHKWEFDWDEDLSLEENLDSCAAEERGLDVLTQMGIIKGERKDNYIKAQHEETLLMHAPESIWGEQWNHFSPAMREYDFIRYVDNVDLEKFYAFCAEHDINYLEKRIMATLEITDQIPSVQTEDKKYYLKALKAGTTLDAIEATRTHLDERLSINKLRLLMGKPNAFVSQKNIKQAFRSNEFGEGNVLCPFAEISSNTFMLKGHANLTTKELATIQKASTN